MVAALFVAALVVGYGLTGGFGGRTRELPADQQTPSGCSTQAGRCARQRAPDATSLPGQASSRIIPKSSLATSWSARCRRSDLGVTSARSRDRRGISCPALQELPRHGAPGEWRSPSQGRNQQGKSEVKRPGPRRSKPTAPGGPADRHPGRRGDPQEAASVLGRGTYRRPPGHRGDSHGSGGRRRARRGGHLGDDPAGRSALCRPITPGIPAGRGPGAGRRRAGICAHRRPRAHRSPPGGRARPPPDRPEAQRAARGPGKTASGRRPRGSQPPGRHPVDRPALAARGRRARRRITGRPRSRG